MLRRRLQGEKKRNLAAIEKNIRDVEKQVRMLERKSSGKSRSGSRKSSNSKAIRRSVRTRWQRRYLFRKRLAS